MCGIVGLFLKDQSLAPELGGLLAGMLGTLCDRGPDSAGFAVYGVETPGSVKLTLRAPLAFDFGALMRQFLDSLPEGGLVMCHPGFVDDVLVSLDPLTTQREHEHAYLAGKEFPDLLAVNKVTLE